MLATLGVGALREGITTLYNEPDSRVDLVASGLRKARVDKVIGATYVDQMAQLSTVSGLTAKGAALCPSLAVKVEGAKPYLSKAMEKEGRQALLTQAYTTAAEISAPYLAKAAPYLEKMGVPSTADELAAKKDALLSDKRLQKVLELLKDVKEHPREAASKLKDDCISLIQYDKCQQYRASVQSSTEAYMAATAKLVQEDLPAIAKEAARQSATSVHDHANLLRAKLKDFLAARAFLRAKVATAPEKMVALMERYLTAAQVERLNELRSQADEVISFARANAAARLPYATANAEKLFARLSVALGDFMRADADEAAPPDEGPAAADPSDPPSPFSFQSGPGPFEALAHPEIEDPAAAPAQVEAIVETSEPVASGATAETSGRAIAAAMDTVEVPNSVLAAVEAVEAKAAEEKMGVWAEAPPPTLGAGC